jgi:hypothetical protein
VSVDILGLRACWRVRGCEVHWSSEATKVKATVNPATHPALPRIDAPWYRKLGEEMNPSYVFAGLEMEKVNMRVFDEGRGPDDYRQLVWYRPIGSIPSDQTLVCQRSQPALPYQQRAGFWGSGWSYGQIVDLCRL